MSRDTRIATLLAMEGPAAPSSGGAMKKKPGGFEARRFHSGGGFHDREPGSLGFFPDFGWAQDGLGPHPLRGRQGPPLRMERDEEGLWKYQYASRNPNTTADREHYRSLTFAGPYHSNY